MKSRIGRFFRGLLCFAVFLLGLCGGCWAIREALPFPDVQLVKTKLDHLAEHADTYDALFLGSSRIYYQLIPALFDQVAAEEGLPVRSFNAAIAGMRPPEDSYYFDRILRNPPKNLRWVFIELAGLRTFVDPEKVGTVRAIYWHDLPRTWMLFKRSIEMHPDVRKRKWVKQIEPRIEQFSGFLDHLPPFLQNEVNLGRGEMFTSRLILARLHPGSQPYGALGNDLSGWVRTGRPEEIAGVQLADFDKALGERRVQKARRDPGDRVSQEALEALIARIEKLGATAVLVVPPTTNKRNFVPSPEREKKTIVLDFCDLEKYPELYEHRYRLDTDHLNTEGSKIFTRLFVKAWAEEVKRRRP